MAHHDDSPSFLARLGLAFRLLGNAEAAAKASRALQEQPAPAARPAPAAPVSPAAPVPAPKPEADPSAGLLLLGLLQREGRLVDFLREDVAPFSDADIGAAARVVHAGCRKVLDQYLSLEPALPGSDGTRVTLPAGFDSRRIRLTGNVAGQPPFNGTLRHHGWVVTGVRLPEQSASLDARVLAAAEVEL